MPTENESGGSRIADPGPLGLAAFALTTFLLSAKNAGWTNGTDAWLGYAFFYGGTAQLLAGMWEFRNRNVFGATAFGTYGAFWLGLGFYAKFVAPGAKPDQIANDQGWILLAFAIVNLYLLIASTKLNVALFAVFLTLQATEVLLFSAEFAGSESIAKIGGYVGVLTALVAWYTSFAGVFNSVSGRDVVKVGGPLLRTR
ncbi:acetate uptake transporter [Actinocatenispora sera]|uniref:Uncharacterized protein n=1 Tax=Actinocatenispora sera TaxID=390989 RepID=A0A810LDT7_9ACTN|nr:GPR1/FUN34/YaaH family transporter [Actinocatenispora sera]BCJ32118.1 hypothetical protein Asera_62260 [Actinocatenispora sera]